MGMNRSLKTRRPEIGGPSSPISEIGLPRTLRFLLSGLAAILARIRLGRGRDRGHFRGHDSRNGLRSLAYACPDSRSNWSTASG